MSEKMTRESKARPSGCGDAGSRGTRANGLRALWHDRDGATAIEYAFIAGFVSIVSVVAWTTMGDTLNTGYTSVSDKMTNAVSGPGSE